MLLKWFVWAVGLSLTPVYVHSNKKPRDTLSHDLAPCEKGWVSFGEKYYRVEGKKETGRMSWEKASNHCISEGGHLASIHSKELQEFLVTVLLNDVKQSAWIGLHDRVSEGNYQWHDKSSFSYTNWEPNEPTGSKNGEEDCVEMVFWSYKGKTGQWNDLNCNTDLAYICQMPKISPPVPKQPSNESRCPEYPEDWRDLDGEYCYFIDIVNNYNWYRANFECIRRGGSLVSIHSKEESDILQPFIKNKQNKIYIGLYRLESHYDVFGWSDGSALDFQNWETNEPDNEDQMCGELSSKNMKWNVVNCEETKGYICSVKKVLPNITSTEGYTNCSGGLSSGILIGAIVCVLLIVIVLGIIIYYFGPGAEERRKKSEDIHLLPPVPSAPRP